MKKCLLNFLYNVDRAVASLCGAAPQETISSEIGRHESSPIDEEAADILDDIQKDHVENAVAHADKLDAADNGQEQQVYAGVGVDGDTQVARSEYRGSGLPRRKTL